MPVTHKQWICYLSRIDSHRHICGPVKPPYGASRPTGPCHGMWPGCGVAVCGGHPAPPPPVCTDTLTHWQSPVTSRSKKEKLSPHSRVFFIVLSCVYMSKQNITCAVRCITRTRDKLLHTPHKNKCEPPSPPRLPELSVG